MGKGMFFESGTYPGAEFFKHGFRTFAILMSTFLMPGPEN
jgi:hypothetical protein